MEARILWSFCHIQLNCKVFGIICNKALIIRYVILIKNSGQILQKKKEKRNIFYKGTQKTQDSQNNLESEKQNQLKH